MEELAKLEKIIVSIGDLEIDMNLEEAKGLYKILSALFQEKRIEYIPTAPIIIEKVIEKYPGYLDYPRVTWFGNTGNDTSSWTYDSQSLSTNTVYKLDAK